MKPSAEEWISRLNLQPHPEGGFFRETYRASTAVSTEAGSRSFATHIYFLLRAGECSHLHRIRSDEGWHFYAGSPLVIHQFEKNYRATVLGSPESNDSPFQAVVPAGVWFGAESLGHDFSLVGCTVSPGFDFADFELAHAKDLKTVYPEHADMIDRLCLR